MVAVDTRADTMELRDDDGHIGTVHVSAHMFDLESLKPGDEVEVDFMVREPGDTKLVAGGVWKVER